MREGMLQARREGLLRAVRRRPVDPVPEEVRLAVVETNDTRRRATREQFRVATHQTTERRRGSDGVVRTR
jgi:hypothetical protein